MPKPAAQPSEFQARLHRARAQMSKGTSGAVAELRAAADLMAKGFHVFRPLSPACPCDLVAWRPGGSPVRVAVKSACQEAPDKLFDALCHVAPDEIIYDPPIDEW